MFYGLNSCLETLDIKEIQVQKKAACATQKPTRATKRQQLPRDILNDENSNSSRQVYMHKNTSQDFRKTTCELTPGSFGVQFIDLSSMWS